MFKEKTKKKTLENGVLSQPCISVIHQNIYCISFPWLCLNGIHTHTHMHTHRLLHRWPYWSRICLPIQEMEEIQIRLLGQEDPLE